MTPAPVLIDSSGYLSLIAAFAQARGMPAEAAAAALGLEFESESGLTARVRSHPQDTGRLLIEVDVLTIDDQVLRERSAALLTLHHINAAARLEHDWSIVIDDESTLMLSVSIWVDRVDLSLLESYLADGIERAQALRAFWVALVAGDADPEAPYNLQTALANGGVVRG